MDVILTKDVEQIGLRGEVVSVARGYARNFLFPRKLAEEATPARVAELKKRDSNRARQEAKTADEAQSIAETLSKTVLRFEVKAGPTGSLFGSVTPTDIADEIWRTSKVASIAGRSASTTSSGSGATTCRSTSSRAYRSR
jgi:ribosomal protein L9